MPMLERVVHSAALLVACALLPVAESPAAPSAFSLSTPPNDSAGPARAYQLQATQVRRTPTVDGRNTVMVKLSYWLGL